VCGVADAEQAGAAPVAQAVDLYGEELHFVPGVDFCSPAFEEGNDAGETLVERVESFLLDLSEGTFGDDVADLKVFHAIDKDDEATVVDVAQTVFRIGGLTGDAEP